MMGTALSLPLAGRVAAKRSGGVGSAGRNASHAPSPARATPSGLPAISPARGERTPA